MVSALIISIQMQGKGQVINMKKKSIRILCMMLLFTFIAAGCSNANNEVEDGNKSIGESAEKAVWYKGYYNQKRGEYMGDNDADYFKGYEFYSAGTHHAKRIIYNAVDDGSVISGYAADIQLSALEKGTPKEEDLIKFAEVEFMRYMDSGELNIVQMSCIIKTPDKKKHTFVLRFANEERTRVVQYIADGKDGEYKEVDNSYIEKAGKADTPRYFYDSFTDADCLFKDMESGEILSFYVNVSELVFGKNVDAGYACDIIMEKADEDRKEAGEGDYTCNGMVFVIETNGKNSATVAVIYDEKGYKIFKFNDAVSDMPDSEERIEGKYVDRETLEKELGEIL